MALIRYKLGDLIAQRREKYNGVENLPIFGVSRDGLIPPKQDGADTSIYNVFYKNDFVFNPARMELNSIAYNLNLEKAICSSLYEIFYVKRPDLILPEYLNIFIKRDEFARKCWFDAIGSARNYFRFSNLCEIEIELPSPKIQQRYVDVYNSILRNQINYKKGIDDLRIVCDAYLDKLKKKLLCEPIGKYIKLVEAKNLNKKYGIDRIKGISINKEFIETKANTNDLSTFNYNIVSKSQFTFNPNTARMGEKFCIALNASDEDLLVSAIYPVFEIKCKDKLIPEYLMMFFIRIEFDRYVRYNSWGSARETFNYSDLENVSIPIPNLKIQESIVNIYKVYKERKDINEKLKKIISNICPVLIKGSIEEAMKEG